MYILFTVSGSLLRDLWTFLQQTCELGFLIASGFALHNTVRTLSGSIGQLLRW